MSLKKNDKIIIGFYIFLAISVSFTILYISTTFEDLPKPNWVIEQLKEIEFERTLEIEQEKLFLTITDVKNFPKILPRNFVSVNILETNGNVIVAEEEVQEKGVRITLLVKHSFIPYTEHTMEILDGDAKGTKIHQLFSSEGNSTKLVTTTKVDFKGLLTPFSYLPESNVRHAMDTVVTSFYNYAKGHDSLEKNKIDELYREILLRPADKEGLEHYAQLLENNQIEINEIRLELLNSEEGKHIVKPTELKQIDELEEETKLQIDKLYREILQRPADKEGLESFGTLLELEKLSIEEIEEQIFNSQEALSIRISLPANKLIDDLYMEVNGRHADWETLFYYQPWLGNKTMTLEEIKIDMLKNRDDS